MPPRMASARQSMKRQQNQQQNQDRGSPATSLDASVSNGKTANANRNVTNTTGGPTTNGNTRKRAAPAMMNETNQANKRKKVEGNAGANGAGAQELTTSNGRGGRQPPSQNQESSETEEPRFTVDFSTLPLSTICYYLQKHDLAPPMYPSPNTQYIPPLPPHLLNPPPPPPQAHTQSPSPPLGPHLNMGRPKRDPKRISNHGSSRRSTRLAEDEFNQTVYGGVKEKLGKPILHDVLEAQRIYADLAKRHWDGIVLKESETIDAFGLAIRNKGRLLKSVV